MMARMGGGVSAAVTRKKRAARRAAEGTGGSDEAGDGEDEMTAAESEERLRRLKDNERVVAELTADAAGGTRKLEDHFDPEGHEGVTAWYLWLAWRCRQTEHANWFVVFIMTVIITASILVGVNTYEFDSMGQQLLSDSAKRVLDTMEVIILVIFWMELTLKAVGCGLKPWRFFFVAWNVFDFIIVVLCVVPGLEGQASLLRLLRLLRVLKLLKMIEQLQVILRGLGRGLTSIGYIAILLFLVFYLFGIIGIMLFKQSDPAHFGGLGHALLTLFRAATMEDWSDLMYTSMLGCGEYGYPALDETGWVPGIPPRNDTITAFCEAAPIGTRIPDAQLICESPTADQQTLNASGSMVNNRACFPDWDSYFRAAHDHAWIMWLGSTDSTPFSPPYYIFFILVAGIVMLSLFIGAVTLGMQEAMDETTESKRKALHEKLKSAARTSQSTLMQNDSTANKVARMWMGEALADVEEEQVAEKRNLYSEAPIWYMLDRFIFQPSSFVANHPLFTKFITGVIILAAILVGFDFTQTQPIDLAKVLDCGGACPGAVTGTFEMAINIIFTFEVVAKLLAEGAKPWRYFASGWNNFDFVIVALAWSPGSGEFVVVLRLLRLLRVLKLVRALPQLQVIVSALISGLGSIGYIAMLLFLIYYVYAIIGMLLFQTNDPWHFGSLHITMFTLFRCSTLEDWTDVMYINMYGCDVYGYKANFMLEAECRNPQVAFGSATTSVVFFLTFVVLTNLVTLSLFIGVVTTSMQEATDKQDEERRKKRQVDELEEKYVNVLMAGLRWTRLPGKPSVGSELKNEKLSAALASGQTVFERAEFDHFNVQGLRWDGYVQAANQEWYKPDALEKEQLEKLQVVAKERVQEFQKIFNIFDWSGDQVIDRQEFSFAIKCLNPKASENQISDWMMLGDEKCTGEIDFLAFCQVLMTLDQSSRLNASKSLSSDIGAPLRNTRARKVFQTGETSVKDVLQALVSEVSLDPSYSLMRMSSLENLANRRRDEGRTAALFADEEAQRDELAKASLPKSENGEGAHSKHAPQQAAAAQRPDAVIAASTHSGSSSSSNSDTAGCGMGANPACALSKDAKLSLTSSTSSAGGADPSKAAAKPLFAGKSPLKALQRAGRRTMATRRFAKAPLAALALGEATVPPEMGELVRECADAQVGGKDLELVLLKLGRLKAALNVRLQRSKTSDGNEPSTTTLFCEALRGQMDDLEASLYIQLKPKLIGTDEDGNGQLVLGGHVVAQVVHHSADHLSEETQEKMPATPSSTQHDRTLKAKMHRMLEQVRHLLFPQAAPSPASGASGSTVDTRVEVDDAEGQTALEIAEQRAADRAASKIQGAYRTRVHEHAGPSVIVVGVTTSEPELRDSETEHEEVYALLEA